MATRTATNFWIDVVSLAVMIGLTATGGLMRFVLPPGTGHSRALFGWNRHDIGQLHFYLAVAAVVLLALHVLLHWSWICCVIAKLAGKPAPSERSRTAWGLGLLLGNALWLGGGLWWVSGLVQVTAPDGGETGRTAHLERPSAGSGRTAHLERPSAVKPNVRRADVHDKRLESCPAGASINGRTSLMEAARICRLGVARLTEQLGLLPANTDRWEQLGRLKRRHGLDIHAVRGLACR